MQLGRKGLHTTCLRSAEDAEHTGHTHPTPVSCPGRPLFQQRSCRSPELRVSVFARVTASSPLHLSILRFSSFRCRATTDRCAFAAHAPPPFSLFPAFSFSLCLRRCLCLCLCLPLLRLSRAAGSRSQMQRIYKTIIWVLKHVWQFILRKTVHEPILARHKE